MKFKLKNIITLIIIIILNGCESIVDVDLPKMKPQVVVNSFFSPDSNVKVHLSKSKRILENDDYDENWNLKIDIIENASVELWSENNFVTNLSYLKNGNYSTSDFFPIANKEYNVVINVPEYNLINAADKIPAKVEIKNVEWNIIEHNEYWLESELAITFQDIPNENNYYMLSLFTEEVYNNLNYRNYIYYSSNDIVLSEKNILEDNEQSYIGSNAIFTDEIFSGNEYTLKVKFDLFSITQKITVNINTLSETMYKYFKSLEQQNNAGDNPFAEPVFVNSNVKNGLGIFAGYNSSFYKVN
jgi:hypothetical protein